MVYILLGDGFETVEALCPADLMRRAGIDVALVGIEDKTVVSGQKIAVQADITLDQVSFEDMEMVMLPGGLGGVNVISGSIPAISLLQRAADQGIWISAICAAPTILAHLGLLDRRNAIVYPGMEEDMGSAVVKTGRRVVRDGRFITGQAAGASFDFGLELVEVLRGKEAAEQVRMGVHYND
ncbi:MAG: DJ-1/PfpI family protein [Clostridiales bacterium]|nr:DJ-1/PfpI family protein [Clostridiales bacterium]